MRLFIGIDPGDAARAVLARDAAALRDLAYGRFVPPENYHLTLAFLGEQDAREIPRICEAMRMAAGVRSFSVALGRLGAFGPVLWRGVTPEDGLASLADRLRAALDGMGIGYDSMPFRAHITLVRNARLPRGLPPCAPARFVVRSLILYESVRGQDVPRYLPRAEEPLRP